MSITLPIISLLFCHFLGDFFLQSDWMALNKGKNWGVLALHCVIYTLCFGWCGPEFCLVVFGMHFLTDALTSRLTTALWFFMPVGEFYNIGGQRYEMWIPRGGNRHYFFTTIGFDQLIHYVTLCLAWRYLV